MLLVVEDLRIRITRELKISATDFVVIHTAPSEVVVCFWRLHKIVNERKAGWPTDIEPVSPGELTFYMTVGHAFEDWYAKQPQLVNTSGTMTVRTCWGPCWISELNRYVPITRMTAERLAALDVFVDDQLQQLNKAAAIAMGWNIADVESLWAQWQMIIQHEVRRRGVDGQPRWFVLDGAFEGTRASMDTMYTTNVDPICRHVYIGSPTRSKLRAHEHQNALCAPSPPAPLGARARLWATRPQLAQAMRCPAFRIDREIERQCHLIRDHSTSHESDDGVTW